MISHTRDAATDSPALVLRRCSYVAAAVLVVVPAALVLPGLDWGLPAATSWAPDTIAGTRTLRTIGRWPDRWPTHYPPLHFLINRLAYAHTLNQWEREGEMVWAGTPTDHAGPPVRGTPGADGVVPIFAPPVADRVGRLIMISRAITAVMSVATVLIVAACGRRLFDDPVAGFLAGLTLATCAEWVYFSHLGNLDVPHVFWFALSLYAYIRVCQVDRWRDYLLLGCSTAMSVATKDAIAGVYAGMVIVVAVTRVWRNRCRHGSRLSRAANAVHPKMWAGLAAFALPYAVINGLFVSPAVYVNRLKYYLSGPGIADFNRAYEGPVWLLKEAFTVAAKALGWPMLFVAVAASVVALVRWRRQALMVVVPCAAYYLIVCQYTGMVYARMLFPVYVCVSLVIGRCLSAWLVNSRRPAVFRYGAVVGLYLASIGYCAAVDLEMTNDTRYAAERWLKKNVSPSEWIGVFSPPQYLPRFLVTGHHARPIPMTRAAISKHRPSYLILTSHNYDDFDEEQRACAAELLAGKLGYTAASSDTFSKRFLPPARWWPAVAGWGTRGAGKVSPRIHMLTRTAPQ